MPTPKRKPPSQRPERQMDETAQAIARMREEARAAKSAGEERPAATNKTRPGIGPVGKITDRPKPGGPVVNASTKRPKMGGGA